ncbi:hypothetical protein RhiirA1_390393 [Rhizophagus irregularis]|uniref:Uncharacterized protein n=1 Tax=Rhizophagus irregularis TaxID=588596 RepID=A0A2N0S7X2_9GLOM|nr:hypothetical protein RhiirA1_390393 [Rhizophagus irregularis]
MNILYSDYERYGGKKSWSYYMVIGGGAEAGGIYTSWGGIEGNKKVTRINQSLKPIAPLNSEQRTFSAVHVFVFFKFQNCLLAFQEHITVLHPFYQRASSLNLLEHVRRYIPDKILTHLASKSGSGSIFTAPPDTTTNSKVINFLAQSKLFVLVFGYCPDGCGTKINDDSDYVFCPL